MKSQFGKWISGLTLLLMLGGCAATVTSIEKRHLDVQAQASHSIFLTPVAKPTLYLQVKNTTDKAELDLEQTLREVLVAKGVRVIRNPGKAHYHLQAQVLYVEKLTPHAFSRKNYGGFGGPIGGAALGGGIGRAAGGRGGMWAGGLIGLVVGGAVETVTGAFVKDVTYAVVTDLRLSEKIKGSAKKRLQSRQQQGSTTTVNQSFETLGNRLYYTTRIVTAANKVNLEFQEATAAIKQGLVQSLSGHF